MGKEGYFFVTFILLASFLQAGNLAIHQLKFMLRLAAFFVLLSLGLEQLRVGGKSSLHMTKEVM